MRLLRQSLIARNTQCVLSQHWWMVSGASPWRQPQLLHTVFFLAQTHKFFVSARPDGPDQK